jgi:hypothetical protein
MSSRVVYKVPIMTMRDCAQQKPLLPLGFHQGFKLRLIEQDDLLLLAMNAADENHEEELPWLKKKGHRELVLSEEDTKVGTNQYSSSRD